MVSVKGRAVLWQQWPGFVASAHNPLYNAGLTPGSSVGRANLGLFSESSQHKGDSSKAKTRGCS